MSRTDKNKFDKSLEREKSFNKHVTPGTRSPDRTESTPTDVMQTAKCESNVIGRTAVKAISAVVNSPRESKQSVKRRTNSKRETIKNLAGPVTEKSGKHSSNEVVKSPTRVPANECNNTFPQGATDQNKLVYAKFDKCDSFSSSLLHIVCRIQIFDTLRIWVKSVSPDS